jgi:hypothetical protein
VTRPPISVGPGGSDITKNRPGGYVSRQAAEAMAAAGDTRVAAVPQEVHDRAAEVAAKITAYYESIPAHIRAEVVLDWSESSHWRATPGDCVHCHSPWPTNLVDDQRRYSHKTCAEVSVYLAGPPVEEDPPAATGPTTPDKEPPCSILRPLDTAWWITTYTPKVIDLLRERGSMSSVDIANQIGSVTTGLIDAIRAADPQSFRYRRMIDEPDAVYLPDVITTKEI